MIEIQNTLVSLDLFEKKFVCDLTACKGACCVEGDSGAPLNEDEAGILDDIYNDIKSYLTDEGRKTIEASGKYILDDFDGELVTPLNSGKECSYTIFDADGTAKCGIEKAWLEGKTHFRKPISCQLYPIRVSQVGSLDALNYHQWQVCKPACACGDKLDVKVYRFLKEPIIRKYGESFFNELEVVDNELSKNQLS